MLIANACRNPQFPKKLHKIIRIISKPYPKHKTKKKKEKEAKNRVKFNKPTESNRRQKLTAFQHQNQSLQKHMAKSTKYITSNKN